MSSSNVPYGININVGNESGEANYTWYPNLPPALKPLVYIGEYVTPCIFSIGIFFNVFAAIILRKTDFKKAAPFVYLLALCIIDTVYLIAKVIPDKFYSIYVIPGVCQIVYYLSFLSIFLEWWIVAMLLLERCIALYSSRIACKYFSAFRIKCALIIVSLCAIVAHLYHTWTSIVHDDGVVEKCIIVPEFYQYLSILRKLDVVFAFIVPFSLISMMLTIIFVQLCKRTRRCKNDIRQFVSTSTTVAKRPVSLCVEYKERPRRIPDGLSLRILISKRRITMKLLLIVVLKVVLCIPHDFLKAKLTLFNDVNATEIDRIVLLYLDEIYSLNFSIKGLMCLLLFPSFRKSTCNYIRSKLRYLCHRLCTKGQTDV